MIPYENIKHAALAHAQQLLPEWFPAERIVGREFTIGNLRADAGDSLSINLDTGVWADFDGGAKGGNRIELRAQAHYSGNFKAAAMEVGRDLGVYLNAHPNDAAPIEPARAHLKSSGALGSQRTRRILGSVQDHPSQLNKADNTTDKHKPAPAECADEMEIGGQA